MQLALDDARAVLLDTSHLRVFQRVRHLLNISSSFSLSLTLSLSLHTAALVSGAVTAVEALCAALDATLRVHADTNCVVEFLNVSFPQ